MRVQVRWADPTVGGPAAIDDPEAEAARRAAMLAASALIAAADVENGAAAEVFRAQVSLQHAADCPPGWVAIVCIAGSPWFDPTV